MKIASKTSKSTARIPPSLAHTHTHYQLSRPGNWLILSDVHLPYHDTRTIQIAVEQAKKNKIAGIILNGDMLDSNWLSDHPRTPLSASYLHEVETAHKFLTYLRGQFPRAEIVYREGNHEDRLGRYVMKNASALSGFDALTIPSLLDLPKYRITWIDDKRVVKLGKLNTLHGHEYKGGGGVNPARWLHLRTSSVAICGHFHRSSEHHTRDIGGTHAAWSIGCACELSPAYMRLSNANHGFAMVRLYADGMFEVNNRRVMDGQLV